MTWLGPPDYSASESFLKPRLGPWSFLLYLHRQPILDSVREARPLMTGRLLDVGCGNKPYRSLLLCREHVGVDVATSGHNQGVFDSVFDGESLPFKDGEFDSVLCTEVLEHARRPLRLAREIGRVLRPGGYALLTAPFVLHHHEAPFDFQRFTRFGMEQLAAEARLEMIWVRPRGGAFAVMMQTVYVAASQVIGRRPFSDIMMWALYPLARVALWLDRWRGNPDVITAGWQLLGRREDAG